MHSLKVRIGVPTYLNKMNYVRGLTAGLALLLGSLLTMAQSNAGRILGTVTDQTGAALAAATVTISDLQRGTDRVLTTDDAGAYVAPDLLPGTYSIRATARSFKSVERASVEVEVAQDVRIDFSLPPGETSETITVTEEVPMLNTTSSTLGGTLSNRQMNDLPLNGRNYENLLQLRPGVVRYPGGGFSTTSTNGLRAEDNVYIIDGLFDSEPFSGQGIINGAGIAGDSATILPIDAIQEFNLQENPAAEYGWKPGAIVNVGLKSGTNKLHGTGYGFYRDGIFDARNYFNPVGTPKTPRSLKQYGGTLGGALIKDKLFFFGGFEGQHYTVGNSFGGISSPATVSLGGDPANSIPDAIAALQAASVPLSTVSLGIAGCTVTGAAPSGVSCNGKGFPTNLGTNPNGPTAIVNGFPNIVTSNNGVGKIDYHLNDSNTVSGMYFFGNNSGTVEDVPGLLQPQWLTLIHTRAQVFGTNWVWMATSRLVNEARFGYSRLFQPTYPADHDVPASSYGGLDTGVPFSPLTGGLPRIAISGFKSPVGGTLGGFKWPKLQGPDTVIQFIDHLSYTRGNHAFKFGGEIHRDGVDGGAYGAARGSIAFGGGAAFANSTPLEDFFAGVPSQAGPTPAGQVLSGNPARDLSNWAYAGFFQDDWRATKTLTLNFGLRYELNTVIKEANNLIGNFSPSVGLVQVGKQISSPYSGSHRDFAPRAGFAWDPTGRGATVIRAGGGLTYETINWESFLAFNNSFGLTSIPTGASLNGVPGGGSIQVGNLTFSSLPNYNTGPVFGNLSPANLSCSTAAPCSILGVDPNLTTPYVYNWTLNVQHAVTNDLSFEIAYVGNHGSNLMGTRDINQVTPAGTFPFAQFPYLANIYQMGNIYRSNYNALQGTLTARNFHGLGLVAGYTYGHALDDVSANWDFGAGLGLPQDSAHPGREYANSDFDMRQRLTLSISYAIPGKHGFGEMLEGWQINSIVTLESSQYWPVIDTGTNVSGSGEGHDRWDFFGDPNDFKSGPTSIPYFAGGSANMPSACIADAASVGASATLNSFGCYAKGRSVMIPPPLGTFGTMGRNIFPDSGFRNWDFSVAKNWKLGERVSAQFRAEFFNILNHPNFANPYGGQNGFGDNDPSAAGPPFGCGCATPDVAAANPVIGSGGSRATQFGLKFIF
jgi:carboxypeptidase family protein